MRRLLLISYILIFSLFTSCSLARMGETLDHASAVIEENTQKMEKAGQIIEENTRQIREYTISMRFLFPVFCATFFLFNYIFFRKILKRLNHSR